MRNDLISIVVPVYNVEKYLKDCVESLLVQTYKYNEIILVDDGSSDNSALICDEYEKNYNMIKVIHKTNGGLSDARNAGLKKALGKYICFIDSDDVVASNYIHSLYNAIVETNAKMSACPLAKFLDGENYNDLPTINGAVDIQRIDAEELMINIYDGNYSEISFVACGKLYEKKLFDENDIEYPFGRYYEDTFTTFRLFLASGEVSLTNNTRYYYRNRNNSIMTSDINEKKIMDAIASDEYVAEYFINNNKNRKLISKVINYCLKDLLNTYYRDLKNLKGDKKKCKNNLIRVYKKIYSDYLYKGDLPIIKRVIFECVNAFFSAVNGNVISKDLDLQSMDDKERIYYVDKTESKKNTT